MSFLMQKIKTVGRITVICLLVELTEKKKEPDAGILSIIQGKTLYELELYPRHFIPVEILT